VRGTNFCTDALLGAIYAERGLMAVTADMEHLRHCLPRECVTSGTRVGALLARAVRRRRPGTAAGRRHRQRSCRHGRQDPPRAVDRLFHHPCRRDVLSNTHSPCGEYGRWAAPTSSILQKYSQTTNVDP
jgi:hypothetical protein